MCRTRLMPTIRPPATPRFRLPGGPSTGGYRGAVIRTVSLDDATTRRLEWHETMAHAIPSRVVRDLGDALVLHDPRDPDPFWNRMVSVRWPASPDAFDRRLDEAVTMFALRRAAAPHLAVARAQRPAGPRGPPRRPRVPGRRRGARDGPHRARIVSAAGGRRAGRGRDRGRHLPRDRRDGRRRRRHRGRARRVVRGAAGSRRRARRRPAPDARRPADRARADPGRRGGGGRREGDVVRRVHLPVVDRDARALPWPRPRRARHAPRRRDRGRDGDPRGLPRRVQRQRPRPPAVRAARVRVRWASRRTSCSSEAVGPPHLAGRRPRAPRRRPRASARGGVVAARLAGAGLRDLAGQRDRSRSCRGGASRRPTTRCPAAAWCSRACPAGSAKPAPAELPPLRPHGRGLGDGRARPGRGRARGVAGRRGGGPRRRRRRPDPRRPGAASASRTACPASRSCCSSRRPRGGSPASLVRDGEGPCALYLHPAGGLDGWLERARERGVGTSTVEAGPFGRSVLVAGGPVAGPHLLVVDAR